MIVKVKECHKDSKVRLSTSCPSIPEAISKTDGFPRAIVKRGRLNTASGHFMPLKRKMSVSSDSNIGDGDAVDSNIKIQINDITPSNSQEFLHILASRTGNSISIAPPHPIDAFPLKYKRHSITEILCRRTGRKSAKKGLARRQSWSSMMDAVHGSDDKMPIQKCWSLSSLDSDVEDIFYDARDIPLSPTMTSTTNDGSSQSISEGVKEKQRSFSAGSKEDVFMSICSQVPGAVQSMNDISSENAEPPVPKSCEKKHSLVVLGSNKSSNNEEWLLAPRTPLQKSVSTPSIIAAQEVQEMVQRRDREGRDSLFSSHRLSLRNVGESSSIAMLREEDEPVEMSNRFLPPLSLAGLFKENLLGGGVQDSDEDKPFSKRKKRGSLFFRKKRNKDKEKENKKSLHQFVSICYSTSAVCDVCNKPLANKPALRCENCMLAIHDSSCKDHTPDCKIKRSKSPPKERSLAPMLQIPPEARNEKTFECLSEGLGLTSSTELKFKNIPNVFFMKGEVHCPARYRHLLGHWSHSMIDLGGKQTQPTKEKRLSAVINTRPQSLGIAIVAGAEAVKLSTPPPSGTPRRNYTPSGYSQWRRVATKLGVNKVICEEKEAEPVDETCSTNITETNSASMESLDEAAQEVSDVEDETLLRLMDEEPETWNTTVDKKILKKLKEKDVKRQEAIYELIITEKHHCLTLKVMQKVFAQGMMKELNISKDMVERIFPCLEDLMDIHLTFLHKLRERQSVDSYVSAIGDLLLEQFQGKLADQMRVAYGQFCSQHKEALSLYKDILKSDRKFQSFIKKCSSRPLCKTRGIPECILLVTQRVTKYPLLIDALIKTTRDNKVETENLNRALENIKNIISQVNAAVAEKERETRLLQIYNKVDAKSTAFFRNKKFKKSDLLSNNRKLRYEGPLAWKSARGKQVDVHAIILSDAIVLLQESNQKYCFLSLDNKQSAVVSLQKLLVREKAGQTSKGIYLISSNPNDPEMYELICQSTKDKKIWIQTIREAVENCPYVEEIVDDCGVEYFGDNGNVEEAKHIKLKELFGLMYEKDLGVAQVCEEKMKVIVDALDLLGYETEGFEKLRYTPLLQKNDEETKQLLVTTLNNASRLASWLYASNSNLNRSVSSAGEHHSNSYISPVLPKRAETFGGFDNQNKSNPSKVLVLKKKLVQLKELTGEISPSGDRELSFSDSNLHMKGHESCVSCSLKFTSRRGSPDKMKHYLPQGALSPKSGEKEPPKFQSQPQLSTSGQDHLELVAELTHHLSTLTCLLSHHFSHVESLRIQLTEMADKLSKLTREHSQEKRERRSIYRADHQLEELRNIQEQLSQERARWQKERAQQEAELAKKNEELQNLKEQLQDEQNQITAQKELLQKQLDSLQREGIMISPLLTADSITDDDDSSCPDVGPNRLAACCDLRTMHQLALSTSRQSWSGPGSEEQKQMPGSPFLLSLSTSNLPFSVVQDSRRDSLRTWCKTTSRHTQWSEDDLNVSSKLCTHNPNGLIGCQASSNVLPVVLSTTTVSLAQETFTSSNGSKPLHCSERRHSSAPNPTFLYSSPEQDHTLGSSDQSSMSNRSDLSQNSPSVTSDSIKENAKGPKKNEACC